MAGLATHDKTLEEAVEIAETVAEALWTLPRCEGVMVSGSVTKGYFDEYSDVDLGLFYDETLPSEDAYLDAIRAIGAENSYDDTVYNRRLSDAWGDIEFRGMDVEIRFHEVSETRALLRDLTDGGVPLPETDLMGYPYGRYATFLAFTVADCRILVERDDVISETKAILEPYASAVRDFQLWYRIKSARHLVEKARTSAHREDALFVAAVSARVVRMMCVALFSLNGVYYPNGKMNRHYFDDFELVPPAFEATLDRILAADLSDRTSLVAHVDLLAEFVESVYEFSRDHYADPLGPA